MLIRAISLVRLECTPHSPGMEQQPACLVHVQVQHRLFSGEWGEHVLY